LRSYNENKIFGKFIIEMPRPTMRLMIQNAGNGSLISTLPAGNTGIGAGGFAFRSGFRGVSMSVGYNASVFERMRRPGCSSCGK